MTMGLKVNSIEIKSGQALIRKIRALRDSFRD
jgi:hypothetical protein